MKEISLDLITLRGVMIIDLKDLGINQRMNKKQEEIKNEDDEKANEIEKDLSTFIQGLKTMKLNLLLKPQEE